MERSVAIISDQREYSLWDSNRTNLRTITKSVWVVVDTTPIIIVHEVHNST